MCLGQIFSRLFIQCTIQCHLQVASFMQVRNIFQVVSLGTQTWWYDSAAFGLTIWLHRCFPIGQTTYLRDSRLTVTGLSASSWRHFPCVSTLRWTLKTSQQKASQPPRKVGRTLPYTRANTPAVSNCSGVHALECPTIVSVHVLKDFRGSRTDFCSLSLSLYGLPAQRTWCFCPLRRKAMKSFPPPDKGT